MLCSSQHLSYASWRLEVFRRLFLPVSSTSATYQLKRRQRFSTSKPHNSLDERTPSNHESSNRHQAAENSTTSEKNAAQDNVTAARPSDRLPKSPFLNKVRDVSQKERKRRPTKEDLDRLRSNPYALALATPPRQCIFTGYRQPTFFLANMGLVRRPPAPKESFTRLWWTPVDLYKDELLRNITPSEEAVKRGFTRGNPMTNPLNVRLARVSYRSLLLHEMSAVLTPSTGKYKRHLSKKLLSPRWRGKRSPLSQQDMKALVWRQDMTSFVLKGLRKEAAKALQNAAPPDEETGRKVWSVVLSAQEEVSIRKIEEGLKKVNMENMQTGAVLVMGHGSTTPETEFPKSALPDYVTLPQTRSKVPVYDLGVLLSEANRQSLRDAHPLFREQVLFFRPIRTKTLQVSLALWRLKGYVMHDVDWMTGHSLDP